MAEEIEDENLERDEEFSAESSGSGLENVIQITGMYNEWFLDYASYVILERAVPHLNDGFKPVQRRIMHSLKELDDGRFHKVANVIGNTMKFHPHGDASIGDALVQVGQKELLLDMQGNWGNILTGDRAAAPRYIEVKLSKFALDVVFNSKTTKWLSSYDGRNKEPETLPVKFPILLAHGVEGIAVGLACKILPHNFIELIDGSIDILRGKKTQIVPDFLTGGMADFSDYNDGIRGGKIKVRARIKKEDNKTLIINEIPFTTTTSSLIDSILKANDKGKIKIKKVEDNTAELVEIVIHLAKGVSPDKTIDALYAFSDCEVSISPNSCVIDNDTPQFLGVNEQLRISTEKTRELLKRELEIKKAELQESWHFASLEKIFIENRIYRDIEECETWEAILESIHLGLKPYTKHLLRTVTDDDVTRLTEIRIKRISKFDSFKADEKINNLEADIKTVVDHLNKLTEFAIDYFKMLKSKYGEGKERKTEIRSFQSIDAAKVAVSNAKLYANYEEGFIGSALKRGEGEFICECSDIDDIIIFRADGKMIVTRISTKAFVGKNILDVRVWKKGDVRTVYNMIYLDGKDGRSMMKRFSVTSITRDKEYDLTKGKSGSKVMYFTANPNGEAEIVSIQLRRIQRVKKLKFDIDFSELAIKGRGAGGNILSKYPVKKIELKEKGVSTLGARKIWYDETVRKLNSEGRGSLLGDFMPNDRLLVFLDNGEYQLIGFSLSNHFDDNMISVEKWVPKRPVSAVYHDGEKDDWYVKRFLIEPSNKAVKFITEHEQTRLAVVTSLNFPEVQIRYNKRFKHTRDLEDETIALNDFIAVKGLKALGNKLSALPVTEVHLMEADQEKEKAANEVLLARPKNSNKEDIVIEGTVDVSEESDVIQNPDDVVMEVEPASPKQVRAKPVSPPLESVKDNVSKPIDLDVDSEDSTSEDKDLDDEGQFTMF